MFLQVALVLALLFAAAADAAEPVAATAKTPAAKMVAPAPERKPLDLRVGHVSKYMMPGVYQMALNAPDADANTVIVQGTRELLPMKSMQRVPGGIIAPFWALAHPLQSWRILAPDLNAPLEGPTIDKVPPRVLSLGPVAPGNY
jgi:hypothetical protein